MTTADDVRTSGTATTAQRAELRDLLQTKIYPKEWRDQFYADVQADGGLSLARAAGVLKFLRGESDREGCSVRATTEQIEQIEKLLPQRIAPGPWARQIRERITAGTLTAIDADRYLNELDRLPKKVFVAPTGLRSVGDAPIGYFAITGDDGRVRCYRIHIAHGELIVEKFTSPDTQKRYRLRHGKATTVLQAVTADPAAAGRLFATTRKHCCDCNQPIRREDQPGFADGLGFDCWQHRQAAATPEGTNHRA